MKRDRAQQEICKAMIRGHRVYRYVLNEEEIGVAEGERGYAFRLEECVFDVSKLLEPEGRNIFEFMREDSPLERTPLLLVYGGALVRRYKGSDFSIFISEKYAKEFEDEYFFGSKEGDRVLITDAARKPVGVVAPIFADEGMLRAIMGE